jgi:hypothetical protein
MAADTYLWVIASGPPGSGGRTDRPSCPRWPATATWAAACRFSVARPGADGAVLVTVLAALGGLNSVLMATCERAHDLGVFKPSE